MIILGSSWIHLGIILTRYSISYCQVPYCRRGRVYFRLVLLALAEAQVERFSILEILYFLSLVRSFCRNPRHRSHVSPGCTLSWCGAQSGRFPHIANAARPAFFRSFFPVLSLWVNGGVQCMLNSLRLRRIQCIVTVLHGSCSVGTAMAFLTHYHEGEKKIFLACILLRRNSPEEKKRPRREEEAAEEE